MIRPPLPPPGAAQWRSRQLPSGTVHPQTTSAGPPPVIRGRGGGLGFQTRSFRRLDWSLMVSVPRVMAAQATSTRASRRVSRPRPINARCPDVGETKLVHPPGRQAASCPSCRSPLPSPLTARRWSASMPLGGHRDTPGKRSIRCPPGPDSTQVYTNDCTTATT